MGRIYAVTYNGTFTAAGGNTDILEITPADDKPVKLRGLLVSQISEVGDAAEEGIRATVQRFPATVTGGTGGSTVTPVPMDSGDSAAGFTAKCNNTAVATTSGTAVIPIDVGWNVRIPLEWWGPEDRFCPKVKQAEALIVRLETTPADDITFSATFWLEEE